MIESSTIELTELDAMRFELYSQPITQLWLECWRNLAVDYRTIEADAGCLVVCWARFSSQRFEFVGETDEGALMSAVIEVFDDDGETVIDLCAWPIDRPNQFGTAFGLGEGLGVASVGNQASYFGNTPLAIHRTPVGWLRAGCRGVVVLNPQSAPRWLGAALGDLVAEDIPHGREIARLLHPFFEPSRIFVPRRARAA